MSMNERFDFAVGLSGCPPEDMETSLGCRSAEEAALDYLANSPDCDCDEVAVVTIRSDGEVSVVTVRRKLLFDVSEKKSTITLPEWRIRHGQLIADGYYEDARRLSAQMSGECQMCGYVPCLCDQQ